MGISATIFGCSGQVLTDEERAFFTRVQPWGFILFARNIDNPEQVKSLVSELKACVDHDPVPILIDQEGGRVRRLRPPNWPDYGAGSIFGERYREDPERGRRLAWLQSRLMADDLQQLGINVDCLPVLDVPVSGCHDVIGDRAFSSDPETVAVLGKAACDGLLEGGVLPVIKHVPGHGRAQVDSHKKLPIVNADLETLAKTDFAPFAALSAMPLAMTAHIVYSAVDETAPATSSPIVIEEIIRRHIGFDGLLMCDDIAMNALSGDFSQRTKSAFDAGCDVVLHCWGNMAEMVAVSEAAPMLEGKALERAEQAMALVDSGKSCDVPVLREEYEVLSAGFTQAADPTEAGY